MRGGAVDGGLLDIDRHYEASGQHQFGVAVGVGHCEFATSGVEHIDGPASAA
ncbi:Uncharacterised protein [Mycobacteroides abscessus subsp. abscessus]|nr:Uncharacterised protein [Mycobacteroides abscessus subsp. abscessus]SIB93383.1 Uncharacterised protein [Mycobacteroides abscessus subsp. abscessus]SIG58753.1 Uncharacterised protein [Mycobacteroides abscessus subsp. abscessus]SIG99669.1 Uncharacterised protein [Mycobacteroides abscessus subsp. abscessus]SKM27455.1 Uncharacterised protein [Mycobacteroides abscessus subsp. abscessus]